MKKKSRIVVRTGLTKLDAIISGFRGGELAVIAGRPSMGTSALLYTILNNGVVETKEKPCVVCFQPELSMLETKLRFDCINARVDILKATQWRITKDELHRLEEAHKKIFPMVFIYDWPAVKLLSRIRKEAINLNRKCHLKVIAIDYLRLIRSEFKRPPSHKDTTRICASLKRLAKQLNVAIILLSRVPRTVERRRPQIPKLLDLKKYGEVEKYADKVLFIYREEYYGPTDGNKGVAKIIVAKNLGGHVGMAGVKFTRRYLCFDNA